jgi:hypothetical protein
MTFATNDLVDASSETCYNKKTVPCHYDGRVFCADLFALMGHFVQPQDGV